MKAKVITRTIESTNALLTTLDLSTNTVGTQEFSMMGKLSEAQVLREAKKLYETASVKVVAVAQLTPVEQMYGITDEDFVKYGFKIEK